MNESLIPSQSYLDYYSAIEAELEEIRISKSLKHYASQLLDKGVGDEEELKHALHKAITALNAAHLQATKHFRSVYICAESQVVRKDWLVSALGIRLILLNADVSSPVVASLQVKIMSED